MRHCFKEKNLIFGNDLDSLALSYLTGIPIVCENLNYPTGFEYFSTEHHLELLNFSDEKNEFRTPSGVVSYNDSKLNIYKKLCFFLSILGKIKFADNVKFVSLENPNCLKVCSETNKIYHIEFDKLYIVNDNILKDSDYELIEQKTNRVLEKFHVGKQLSFGIDLFQNENDFIKNVYINYSNTISCTAESFIPHDKMDDLEYSLFYTKYILMDLFRKHGNDFSEAKNLFTPLKKEIYERKTIEYNKSDTIQQIRFNLEDYLWQRKSPEPNLELQDAYQLIVAHKFLSMCTQIF